MLVSLLQGMTQYCSIIHSPNHDDRFLLCSSRCIRLFHTSSPGPTSQPTTNQHVLSKDFAAQKVKERQLSVTATAFDWYPTNDGNGANVNSSDHLVAVGDQNGRISVVNMHETSSSDSFELCASRTQRPTFFLHWNPFRKGMLAQGLDRPRNSKESTIVLWDVSEAGVQLDSHGLIQHINKHSAPNMSYPQSGAMLARLDSEIPFTESLSSFTWTGPSSFVVGLGGKYLRSYELSSLKQETVTTKYVHGLCVERNSKNFIASFHGSQASVWMLRKLDRPVSVFSMGHDRQVLQLAWCPTRSGYLAVLGKDSRSLFVFDTIHLSLSTNPDELNQSLMERHVAISSPGSLYHLVSMAWLPAMSGAFVAIDSSGQLFFKHLLERVTVSISPAENKFFWSRGSDSGETSGTALEKDISHDMRRLALKNYGLELDKSAAACAALFPEDDHRHEMWLWLEHLCALTRPVEKPRSSHFGRSMPNPSPATSPYLLGVRGTLSMNADGSQSSADTISLHCSDRVEAPWIHSGPPDSLPRRVVNWQYRSEERSRILRLCQLGHETVANTIDSLRNAREFERSACLALLHLDFGLAIDILRRGAEYQQRHPGPALSGLNLELIALALTGFSDERNKTWHGVARDLLPRLKHPYLQLMFSFIAAERGDDLESCTTVDGIRVVDRVALAALYLPDDKLAAFVDILTEECKKMASLEGLVLTGLGPESLELLQAYLDRTGDVQTVSLVCLLGLRLNSDAMRRDKRPNRWASAYRDLLDGWRMWSHRANFDIQRQACDPGYRAPAQIYVACGFCGGKVMHGGQPGGMAASRRYTGNTTTASGKTSICQSCRKPLPRCAVCLMHTGTAAGMLGGMTPTNRVIPFQDWFVWCLKCRHGGHTAHIAAWFKDNRDCPVSGCTCSCSELDRTSFSAVESLG